MKSISIIVSFVFLLAGCSSIRVPNDPFRTYNKPIQCDSVPIYTPAIASKAVCGNTIIENYKNHSVGYIEFTERGNLFSDKRNRLVLDAIAKEARTDNGVAVVVFVHGWKHNSSAGDSNVIEFNELLDQFAANELLGSSNRKVFGVYLGWRGSSYPWGWLENLTFWDRKAVAEEVGAGGVTAVLTQLQNSLIKGAEIAQLSKREEAKILSPERPFGDNSLLIIGHSFGGAIVLSSLHDVYVNSLAKSYSSKGGEESNACEGIERFADGVVLLNPAIEANKIVQIKELAANCKYEKKQPHIMHVISSDADLANKWTFPAGQWLDLVLRWNQDELSRTISGKPLNMHEKFLDTQTVGNLEQFRTGYLEKDSEIGYDWTYSRCKNDLKKCRVEKPFHVRNHFPVNNGNPIVFLKTDGAFMGGHNDVFNCAVKSYISTIVLENQAIITKPSSTPNYRMTESQKMEGCSFKSDHKNGDDDFGRCFVSQLKVFEQSRIQSCKRCQDRACEKRYCDENCAGEKLR